jgi:hypothetical protein
MSSPESDIEGPVVIEDETVDSLRSVNNSSVGITLKEQLDREFTTTKQQEAFAKMNKKISALDEFQNIKKKVISFKYATDYSFLRRSSPDQVWVAIQRREAWSQFPVAMFVTTILQVGICAVVVISAHQNVHITPLIAVLSFVAALGSMNTFTVCRDLTGIFSKAFEQGRSSCFFWTACIFLFPMFLLCATIAYAVCITLDLLSGTILDVSYPAFAHSLANNTIIFSAISVALRSDDLLTSLQVLAGFHFVYALDALVLARIEVDLLAPTRRVLNVSVQVAAVRILTYVSIALLLAYALFFTFANECAIFCTTSQRGSTGNAI